MTKQTRESAGLPVLEFDWADKAVHAIAENIWHAQKAGWPNILTYDYVSDRAAKSRKRYWAMDAEKVLRIASRDEYPFTCTMEHNGSVWVGHVPPAQNTEQGRRIHQFLGRHGAYTTRDHPFRFEVRVTNYYPAIKSESV